LFNLPTPREEQEQATMTPPSTPHPDAVASTCKAPAPPAKAVPGDLGNPSVDLDTMELNRFIVEEGLTIFDADHINLKKSLIRRGVGKVIITGFKNGEAGRLRIPDGLLGTLQDSQLLFVACPSRASPPSPRSSCSPGPGG